MLLLLLSLIDAFAATHASCLRHSSHHSTTSTPRPPAGRVITRRWVVHPEGGFFCRLQMSVTLPQLPRRASEATLILTISDNGSSVTVSLTTQPMCHRTSMASVEEKVAEWMERLRVLPKSQKYAVRCVTLVSAVIRRCSVVMVDEGQDLTFSLWRRRKLESSTAS